MSTNKSTLRNRVARLKKKLDCAISELSTDENVDNDPIVLAVASESDADPSDWSDDESVLVESDSSSDIVINPVEPVVVDVRNYNLLPKLNDWYVGHNAHSLASYTNLLTLLKPYHPELPKCAKTALQSNENALCEPMKDFKGQPGSYKYMGFVNRLVAIALNTPDLLKELVKLKSIKIVLSTDGVTLFNNSSLRLGSWPIAAMVVSPRYYIPPIVFCIFVGPSKPDQTFLDDFAHEMSAISSKEICFGTITIPVQILGFTADSPARCLLKQIVGSSACAGCERCESRGKRINSKLCFPNYIEGKLRTHDDFIRGQDTAHHHGPSVFSSIPNVDMIRQFFLDPLHLCDEGVGKRLLCKYFFDNFSDLKLSQSQLALIEDDILKAKTCVSADFERPLVSITLFSQWKGVTFRNFFSYFGPVIMKQYLQPVVYEHFLKFCCAMRILRNRRQCLLDTEICKAEELISQFVKDYDSLVGYNDTVYCVHSLLHICEDVKLTKLPLDDFSCYSFENAWGGLKNLLKSPKLPAAQLTKRLRERECYFKMYEKFYDAPQAVLHKGVVKRLKFKYLEIVPKTKGDSFVMQSGQHRVFKVINVRVKQNSCFDLECLEYSVLRPFFNKPIDSSGLGIFEVKPSTSKVTICLTSVLCKVYLIPYKDRFVAMPALHSL